MGDNPVRVSLSLTEERAIQALSPELREEARQKLLDLRESSARLAAMQRRIEQDALGLEGWGVLW